MEKTMLGLVTNPDGVVALEEVPVPRLGENPYAPHDVLLEVEYCGICGSDIHKWGASREEAAKVLHPERKVVQGHEIVAKVREIGSKVTRVKPGDRVVCEIVTFYCGHCPACLEGRFNICNTLKPMDGRAHYVTGGGFAKYTVWPEFQLHVLPEDVNPKSAVLMEPTAGSVHSIVSRMGVRAGESVAILGPGAKAVKKVTVSRCVYITDARHCSKMF